MDFCTQGSLSFPCLLATKSSLVYLLRLSGASSSCTSGGSFFSLSFSGSAPSSVSASEVDILLGSTTGSSSTIGSLEFGANNFFFLQLRILLDSLRIPPGIERVLGVCSTPSLYTISL